MHQTVTGHHFHTARAVGLALCLLAADAVLLSASVHQAAHAWARLNGSRIGPTPADAVPTAAWAALAGVSIWAGILLCLAVRRLAARSAEGSTGPPSRAPWSRRLAELLLALTALGAVHGGAWAAQPPTVAAAAATSTASASGAHHDAPAPSFGDEPASCARPPVPGWTPAPPPRTDQRDADCAALLTGTPHTADAVVTVRRGDCLWSLVARHLGPDADPATIAATWPKWYAHNRDVIGDDPSLLRPGQQLSIPASAGRKA